MITSFHGNDVTKYTSSQGKNVYKTLFKEGDFYTVVSSFIEKQTLQLGCPANKIVRMLMGVDTSKFTFQECNLQPSEPLKITTVARLTEKKGIEYSISQQILLRYSRNALLGRKLLSLTLVISITWLIITRP